MAIQTTKSITRTYEGINEMIEGLIAIIMLFIGVVNGNTDYFLASALFSIASYLGEKEDKNG